MGVRDMLPSWYLGAKMVHFWWFETRAFSRACGELASRAVVSYLFAYLLSCLAAILASAELLSWHQLSC